MRKLLLAASLLAPIAALAAPGSQSYVSAPAGTVTGNPSTNPMTATPHAQAYANVGHLAILKSANMNVTTDQAMTMLVFGVSRYVVTSIMVTGCSASPASAVGGIYTAASKAGTAVVAANQTYTSLGSATALQILGNPQSTLAMTASQFYFALTTANGSAATCDIYVDGIGLQ